MLFPRSDCAVLPAVSLGRAIFLVQLDDLGLAIPANSSGVHCCRLCCVEVSTEPNIAHNHDALSRAPPRPACPRVDARRPATPRVELLWPMCLQSLSGPFVEMLQL